MAITKASITALFSDLRFAWNTRYNTVDVIGGELVEGTETNLDKRAEMTATFHLGIDPENMSTLRWIANGADLNKTAIKLVDNAKQQQAYWEGLMEDEMAAYWAGSASASVANAPKRIIRAK